MKLQARHIFFLKITAIVLLSLVGAWLFLKQLLFSSILLLLLIVALAVSLYYDRKKMIGRMEQMISSIRHADFSSHFVHHGSGDELSRLSQEMNEALDAFRSHAHDAMRDEAETQAWQKLISVLTHEIMNSITPIISLSETLSEKELSDEVDVENYRIMKRAMDTIHRRSKGLLSFVENYRKLTRLPQPTIQPIAIQPMLQSLRQLMASSGIAFDYEVYPEQLILKADKTMVEQLLLNLLKNAHEASAASSEPRIEVRAEKLGSEIHISVSDNGHGIAPEAIEKIFIPFYSTKSNGSGIGLTLCRQIALRHKGKIVVKSDNKGSKFTVVFPE
ncbi:MAG: HAMP domain-containing sensor histidine kinase [Bacteroidota bacterium]|jgi:signal transduction histidine kinase|nr:HAMP domain-containing sensor histidine kinase [Bacteroidota bacterium]